MAGSDPGHFLGEWMQIAAMAALANRRSNWSRVDEVYNAINSGAKYLYDWIMKETKGEFIKWDNSSVVIIPNTDEYALPADLEDLIRVRERINAADSWRRVLSGDLDDNQFLTSDTLSSSVFYDDPISNFRFFGPYRDLAAAEADSEVQKIRFGPMPVDNRQIELVYRGKFIEITDETSHLFVPLGAHDACLDFATAELLLGDDDDRAEKLMANGEKKLQIWMYTERQKLKGGQTPQVEPYA